MVIRESSRQMDEEMEGIISSKSDRNSKRDNYSNGNGSSFFFTFL